MELKELEKKLNDAEERVSKYAHTVERNRAKVERLRNGVKDEGSEFDLKFAEEDLQRSEWKLEELKGSRDNWAKKVSEEKERIRQYAECVPSVMHEFCDGIVKAWDGFDKAARDKAKVTLERYYTINHSMCEYRNMRKTDCAEYKELENQMNELILKNVGYNSRRGKMRPWEFGNKIREIAKRTDEEIHAKNVSDAEELVRELYFRVAAITGTVETWSGLHVAQDGHGLDGIVTGKEGTCKVQTVGAGGYNIQRFHFRCLTHKVA